MKTVFSKTTDVIESYLNGNGEARNRKGIIFARGNRIYSCGTHYCLAELLDGQTIWLNDVGYSPTTNRHISEVSWIAQQNGFTVLRETEVNLDHVADAAKEAYEKLERARKPEMYRNQLRGLWERFLKAQKVAKKQATWLAEDFRTSKVKKVKSLCIPA